MPQRRPGARAPCSPCSPPALRSPTRIVLLSIALCYLAMLSLIVSSALRARAGGPLGAQVSAAIEPESAAEWAERAAERVADAKERAAAIAAARARRRSRETRPTPPAPAEADDADPALLAFASAAGWTPGAPFSVERHVKMGLQPRQLVREHWAFVTLTLTDDYYTYTCEFLRDGILASLGPQVTGFMHQRESFVWATMSNTKPLFWLIPHVRALIERHGPRLVVLFCDAHDSRILASREAILARFIALQRRQAHLRVLSAVDRSCWGLGKAECAALPRAPLTRRCVPAPSAALNSGGFIGGAVDVYRLLVAMRGRDVQPERYFDQTVMLAALLAEHATPRAAGGSAGGTDVEVDRDVLPLLRDDGGARTPAEQLERLGLELDYEHHLFMAMHNTWDPDAGAPPNGDAQWIDAPAGEEALMLAFGLPLETLPEARLPLPLPPANVSRDEGCARALARRAPLELAELLEEGEELPPGPMRFCNGWTGTCPAIVHFNGASKPLQLLWDARMPGTLAWRNLTEREREAAAGRQVVGDAGPYWPFRDGPGPDSPYEHSDMRLSLKDFCCGPWAHGAERPGWTPTGSKRRPDWLECPGPPPTPPRGAAGIGRPLARV
jgi:hypothetical protein